MEPFTWTFVRGEDDEEQLTIVRVVDGDRVTVTVTTAGTSRSMQFTSPEAARVFQADMEAFLIKTGWSFVRFSPERRTGADRGSAPRVRDRRRWWTDGMITVKQFLDWDDAENERRRVETTPDRKSESH